MSKGGGRRTSVPLRDKNAKSPDHKVGAFVLSRGCVKPNVPTSPPSTAPDSLSSCPRFAHRHAWYPGCHDLAYRPGRARLYRGTKSLAVVSRSSSRFRERCVVSSERCPNRIEICVIGTPASPPICAYVLLRLRVWVAVEGELGRVGQHRAHQRLKSAKDVLVSVLGFLIPRLPGPWIGYALSRWPLRQI